MKTTKTQETIVFIIMLIPFIYLAMIWGDLPDEIPLHWNAKGEIDRYGGKGELISLPFMLSGLTYAIMLAVPFIDPKKKIQNMGNKYFSIRMGIQVFVSGLCTYILYMTQDGASADTRMIFVLVSLLFTVLGNYFKTIKPNYFVGIKTPWTLENEQVWVKTHKMAGLLWFYGGILSAIVCYILPASQGFYAFISITIAISIVPVVYSYLEYQKITKQSV